LSAKSRVPLEKAGAVTDLFTMVKKTYSEILPAAIDATAVEARLKALAERHRRAGNVGIQVLNMVGGQAEGLLSRLPVPVRSRLDDSTERALRMAMETAHRSRGYFPDSPGWLSRAMTTAMGMSISPIRSSAWSTSSRAGRHRVAWSRWIPTTMDRSTLRIRSSP